MHPLVAHQMADTLQSDRLAEAARARRVAPLPRPPGRVRHRAAVILSSLARRLDPATVSRSSAEDRKTPVVWAR